MLRAIFVLVLVLLLVLVLEALPIQFGLKTIENSAWIQNPIR
jgi:hypothetical protein